MIIEAAAMKRPASTFDDGGIPEIVQHGRTGWLVREPDGLAAVMAEVSANRGQAAAFGVAAQAVPSSTSRNSSTRRASTAR